MSPVAKQRSPSRAEQPSNSRRRVLPPEFIERVVALLRGGRPVRRNLSGVLRLHLDRQLPFLFVYRQPKDRQDVGTDRLVVGEAAYLTALPERVPYSELRDLTEAIARVGTEIFGGFLVLEVWTTPTPAASEAVQSERKEKAADFRIHVPGSPEMEPTVDALSAELETIRLGRKAPIVERVAVRRAAPPGMSPILSRDVPGVYLLGLEVRPAFRESDAGPLYPLLWRNMHRRLSTALKKCAFRFSRTLTTHRPKHFHALGRRVFVRAVWDVDRRLAEISDSFDFLLAVTPVNAHRAWLEFRRNGYQKPPRFLYAHLAVAPALVKRQLFAIPIERIEDPELAWIFRQKQDELDRQLTGLLDRGTPRFVHESIQLYGGVEKELSELADAVLDLTSLHSDEQRVAGRVHAEEFAERARAEIERYRARLPQHRSEVRIENGITGLIVSRGNLLVPQDLSVPASRVEALIQHEVGTHVLTYLNGRAQPFKQLYVGLSGYDSLQEGIAVLSEYLVGGLSVARIRLLAARVAAVRAMLAGADFLEVFWMLVRQLGYTSRTAFTITTRVFRGGGLTKDAAYLRGLSEVLRYLRSGGELEPLWVGKLGAEHVPAIEELLRRRTLKPAPLKPSYLDRPAALKRLRAVKQGMMVTDLIPRRKKR